jgi:predicted SAM-dependent methyltransferase
MSAKYPTSSEILRYIAGHAYGVAGDVATFGATFDQGNGSAKAKRIHRLIETSALALREAQELLARERQRLTRLQLARLGVRPGTRQLKVHIGGGRHALPGWLNLDLHSPELPINVLRGLPFEDGSVLYLFCSHLVEHLYFPRDAHAFLVEAYRVLSADGVARFVVPDARLLLRAYATANAALFRDRDKKWPSPVRLRSRLERVLGYCGAASSPSDFDGHKYGYDFETLAACLKDAGFATVRRSSFQGSRHRELRVDDTSVVAGARFGNASYSLFVEARKGTGPRRRSRGGR